MKLNKLLYFKTIVEQGQISRAARVLHVSQPPLSQQLKELEEDLGVVLIERKARKLEVTREGWALYQRALQILDLVEDIPTEIQRHQGEVEGVATIGCSALLMSSCSKFVFHLRKKYPKINFRCLFEDTSALEHKLRKHAVHFCVMLPPYSRTGLELFPLSITRPCVVVPPSLQTEKMAEAANRGGAIDLSELHEKPLIIFRRLRGGGVSKQIIDTFASYGIKPNIVLDCHAISFIISLLEEGMDAMALVPRSEVSTQLRESCLVCDLPSSFPLIRPHVVLIEQRYLPRAASVACEELKMFVTETK